MTNLLENCRVVICSPDAAAAQTDLDGTVIDMAAGGGFDAVLFVAFLGDVADTCVLELQAQGSATSNGASPSTEATTGTFTAGASTADDKTMVLDVVRPANRYVFSRLKRGTANAAVNAVLAIQYRAHNAPTTQLAEVIKAALAVVK
ncbi:MAG TPA: hypothetical protein VD866_27015 [Urbifossiella sp.]|nr:hypothetical protein [Urbifossiella sp.]